MLMCGSAFAQEVSCRDDAGASSPALTPEKAVLYLEPAKVQCDFHLHRDSRLVAEEVLAAYGIHATVDNSVESRQIPFEVNQLRFDDANNLLKLATGTLVVALSAKQALVVADTKENRSRYYPLLEQKIPAPGLKPSEVEEMKSIAQAVFVTDHRTAEDSRGGMVVRASEPELNAMKAAYGQLFDGQSQLLLDVHLYEIDRLKNREEGISPPTSTTVFNLDTEINSILSSDASLIQEIVASGLASATDYTAILAILVASGELSGTVFNNPFALFGGGLTESGVEWGTTTANLLLNSSDVRSVTQMQLRVIDHEEAKFRSGERYPVITSSYSAVTSAISTSASTVTVPNIQYEDLGLTLKVKPAIRNEGSVGLNFDLEVASLAGSSLNDIPVLNHRQYNSNVDVHFGNTALIASAVSKQDMLSISGYPVPDGTNRSNDRTSTELVITVTPHLIYLAHPGAASPMWLLPVH